MGKHTVADVEEMTSAMYNLMCRYLVIKPAWEEYPEPCQKMLRWTAAQLLADPPPAIVKAVQNLKGD